MILESIGDHIRAWRLDNHLLQSDVARIMGVCEDSIVGWEMRGTVPSIKQMPSITKLIGYLPIEINTSTLAGKLIYYRYTYGMSQEALAKLLGVNESTIFNYEKGNHKPQPKTLQKLKKSFKGMSQFCRILEKE